MQKNMFPAGWDNARVQRVLQHYDKQTEDEVVVEDELVWEDPGHTVMEIPTELVPAVRKLIAKHKKK